MAAGPDGNAWFSDESGAIGRVTPAGAVQEWNISQLSGWTLEGSSDPEAIAFAGSALYVADYDGDIDQIAIAGGVPLSVVPLPLTSGCSSTGVAIGTDGNVWFTDLCGNIGTVPLSNFTTGAMLQWSVTSAIGSGNSLAFLTASPGGVWGTDGSFCGECSATTDNNLYRFLDTGGLSATQGPAIVPVPAFPPTGSHDLYGLTLGPDGNIWTGPAGNATSASPIAKVLFGGLGISTVSSVERASPFISRRRSAGFMLRTRKGFGPR